jgi:hypothetical protein
MFKFVRPIERDHIKSLLEYSHHINKGDYHSRYVEEPHYYIIKPLIIWGILTLFNVVLYVIIRNYADIPDGWIEMIMRNCTGGLKNFHRN